MSSKGDLRQTEQPTGTGYYLYTRLTYMSRPTRVSSWRDDRLLGATIKRLMRTARDTDAASSRRGVIDEQQ